MTGPVTVEMIRSSPWMRMAGEAIIVDLGFDFDGTHPSPESSGTFGAFVITRGHWDAKKHRVGSPGEEAAAANEDRVEAVRHFATEVAGRAHEDAQRHLGENYSVDSVTVQGNSLTFKVFAIDYVATKATDRFFNDYATERWIERVDRYKERLRQDIAHHPIGVPLLQFPEWPVQVSAAWRPGRDITIARELVPLQADEELDEQLRKKKTLAARVRFWKLLSLGATALLLAAALITFAFYFDTEDEAPFVFGWLVFFALCAVLATTRLWHVQTGLTDDVREISARIDLRGLLDETEKRAYRLFQLNSLEVKRYYDQALRQRSVVFFVGVLCILLGFALVGVALYLLTRQQAEGLTLNDRIVVAVLAGVGGVLANFVAVIFLRMFAAIVASMTEFHVRLVATHHAHFANVVAAKITDPHLKDQTLAKLALSLNVPGISRTGDTT